MTLVYLNFAGEPWRYEVNAAYAPPTKRIGKRLFTRKGQPGMLTLYEEVCG
jgi:hypothetical protein